MINQPGVVDIHHYYKLRIRFNNLNYIKSYFIPLEKFNNLTMNDNICRPYEWEERKDMMGSEKWDHDLW